MMHLNPNPIICEDIKVCTKMTVTSILISLQSLGGGEMNKKHVAIEFCMQ